MGDDDLMVTEDQFKRLLTLPDHEIKLHLFALDLLPRNSAVRAEMTPRYKSIADLKQTQLDGLIVSGVSGTTSRLFIEAQKPYIEELMSIVDHAEQNTVSTIWICAAALAAVERSDRIRSTTTTHNQPHYGLFECTSVRTQLFRGFPNKFAVPHARPRTAALGERELRMRGYEITSRLADGDVDSFTRRQGDSLFFFMLGHLEEDREWLFRNYRMHCRRFLRGERVKLLSMPTGYFDARTERAIAKFEMKALERRAEETWDAYFPRDWALRGPQVEAWQAASVQLYRNWLQLLTTGAQHAKSEQRADYCN